MARMDPPQLAQRAQEALAGLAVEMQPLLLVLRTGQDLQEVTRGRVTTRGRPRLRLQDCNMKPAGGGGRNQQ